MSEIKNIDPNLLDEEYLKEKFNKLVKEVGSMNLNSKSNSIQDYYNKAHKFYLIANMYYNGEGVVKNFQKTREYIDLAINVIYVFEYYNSIMKSNSVDSVSFSSALALLLFAKMSERNEVTLSVDNIDCARGYYERASKEGNFILGFDKYYYIGSHDVDKNYPKDGSMQYAYVDFLRRYWNRWSTEKQSEYTLEIFKLLKIAAEYGHTISQYELAKCFYEGKGTLKSLEESFAWFKEAADNGHLDAMIEVAKMYETGEGTLTDINMAIEYYRKAANKGHIPSKVILAKKYATGDYLEKNYLEAIKLYEECIDENNKYESEIGECYYNYALTLSLNESIKYLKLAIENNYTLAKEKLGEVYYILGENSSKEESLKWYQLSIEYGNDKAKDKLKEYYFNLANEATNKDKLYWYLKAAKLGHYESQIKLGEIYYEGKIVEKSFEESAKWYKEAMKIKGETLSWTLEWDKVAAEEGNIDSQIRLAFSYENGMGVKVNYDKAIEWYVKAYEKGSEEAKNQLIKLYIKIAETNEKSLITFNKAIKYYTLAANLGDLYAQRYLGLKYLNGNILFKSIERASIWLTLAAEQGDVESQYILAISYFGDKKNRLVSSLDDSIKWLIKASKNGNKDAMLKLAWCYENGVGVKKSMEESSRLYKEASSK